MSELEIKKPLDIWEKIEGFIKSRESVILLLIILFSVPGKFPQLEWKRGNRFFWIGRLKQASDTVEISKP